MLDIKEQLQRIRHENHELEAELRSKSCHWEELCFCLLRVNDFSQCDCGTESSSA